MSGSIECLAYTVLKFFTERGTQTEHHLKKILQTHTEERIALDRKYVW